MGIEKSMDEIERFKKSKMRDNNSKKGIGGDIERKEEENIRGKMVKMEGKNEIGEIEMEKEVEGRKRNLIKKRRVKRRKNKKKRMRICVKNIKKIRDMVDMK